MYSVSYVYCSVPPLLDSGHSLSVPVKTFNLFYELINKPVLKQQ